MRHNERDVANLLPLTPAVFQILLTLCDSGKHGYAIMREVELRSAGGVRIGPGTLYRSIQKMLDVGLVKETAEGPGTENDDDRRRYYEMTEFGRAVAAAEAQRLAEIVREAQAKKLLPKLRST
jgi:DNA-binding PadR family transcriptional regulator